MTLSQWNIYFNKFIEKKNWAMLINFTSNRTTNDFLLEFHFPKLREHLNRIVRALLHQQIEHEESEFNNIFVVSRRRTTTMTSYAIRLINLTKFFTIVACRSNRIIGIWTTDEFILMPFTSVRIEFNVKIIRSNQIELLEKTFRSMNISINTQIKTKNFVRNLSNEFIGKFFETNCSFATKPTN